MVSLLFIYSFILDFFICNRFPLEHFLYTRYFDSNSVISEKRRKRGDIGKRKKNEKNGQNLMVFCNHRDSGFAPSPSPSLLIFKIHPCGIEPKPELDM